MLGGLVLAIGQREQPREGDLKVGDKAPTFQLKALGKDEWYDLSASLGKRPIVLIFGSYTWPPFRSQSGALNKLYDTYGKQADFRIVYVREAHPEDGWAVPVNARQGVVVNTPRTLAEREKIALECSAHLELKIPIIVDGMDDAVEKAYAGWPDRIYVLDKEGKIAYKGRPGPRGFLPGEAEEALKRLLLKSGAS
jgi:hypothetical protein